jgi:lipopolysaccharide transport system ATP-binding protein
MPTPIIDVHDVGKRYRLGQISRTSFRDEFQGIINRLSGREQAPDASEFWALKDVNFTVQTGEVLGLIGRNGAGKSTLLKILSRITKPTTGRIIIRGRVASLLEVGTGFHPELTGRENVFLNGAILGMRPDEIKRKFDEIVAFSEIEKFIDTPVKRYSSGMYVRLAFSIAAHMEPEILIVDEVLAVGDAAFQSKCTAKIRSVASEGRTVLFVSHNPMAVRMLCSRCMILSEGQLVANGTAAEILDQYLGITSSFEGAVVPAYHDANAPVRLGKVSLVQNGAVVAAPFISEPIEVCMEFSVLKEAGAMHPNIFVHTAEGDVLFSSMAWADAATEDSMVDAYTSQKGLYRARCTLPADYLNAGQYSISVLFITDQAFIALKYDHVIGFKTIEDGAMRRERFTGLWIGQTRPRLRWVIESRSE